MRAMHKWEYVFFGADLVERKVTDRIAGTGASTFTTCCRNWALTGGNW